MRTNKTEEHRPISCLLFLTERPRTLTGPKPGGVTAASKNVSPSEADQVQTPPSYLKTSQSRAWVYLDAEVASVHVVAQEQVAGAAGGPPHLKQLHQVKELSMDVPAHWTQRKTT